MKFLQWKDEESFKVVIIKYSANYLLLRQQERIFIKKSYNKEKAFGFTNAFLYVEITSSIKFKDNITLHDGNIYLL